MMPDFLKQQLKLAVSVGREDGKLPLLLSVMTSRCGAELRGEWTDAFCAYTEGESENDVYSCKHGKDYACFVKRIGQKNRFFYLKVSDARFIWVGTKDDIGLISGCFCWLTSSVRALLCYGLWPYRFFCTGNTCPVKTYIVRKRSD